jgi:ubiquinone/menaquinone biosynthesis C-methylase UbiE
MDVREEYRKWSESAYYWNLHRAKIEQIYAPITEGILKHAQIISAHLVLDVGGGAGEPSLSIQKRTGARIVFTDPTPAMANFTRAEAKQRNLNRITFCSCSGDHLPFFDHTFDRIVSRLSMMFVPDTFKAARELLRITKTNARITMAVWNDTKYNPMHSVPTNALKPYIPSDPQPPDAPGGFRFAEAGKLAGIFQQAGARQIEESVVDFEISAIESIEDFWEIRSQMSESLRDKMAKLPADRREEAIAAVKVAVQPYFVNGRMRFPASVRVITVTA